MKKEQFEENEPKTEVVGKHERTDQFVMVTHDLFKRGRYLTNSAKWLYVTLRSFMGRTTGKTFPSYKKITERGGLTKNAIAKGLAELERFGYIIRYKSDGRHNKYIFTYPSIQDPKSGKEVGNQVYPTKEMAEDWAIDQRQRKII